MNINNKNILSLVLVACIGLCACTSFFDINKPSVSVISYENIGLLTLLPCVPKDYVNFNSETIHEEGLCAIFCPSYDCSISSTRVRQLPLPIPVGSSIEFPIVKKTQAASHGPVFTTVQSIPSEYKQIVYLGICEDVECEVTSFKKIFELEDTRFHKINKNDISLEFHSEGAPTIAFIIASRTMVVISCKQLACTEFQQQHILLEAENRYVDAVGFYYISGEKLWLISVERTSDARLMSFRSCVTAPNLACQTTRTLDFQIHQEPISAFYTVHSETDSGFLVIGDATHPYVYHCEITVSKSCTLKGFYNVSSDNYHLAGAVSSASIVETSNGNKHVAFSFGTWAYGQGHNVTFRGSYAVCEYAGCDKSKYIHRQEFYYLKKSHGDTLLGFPGVRITQNSATRKTYIVYQDYTYKSYFGVCSNYLCNDLTMNLLDDGSKTIYPAVTTPPTVPSGSNGGIGIIAQIGIALAAVAVLAVVAIIIIIAVRRSKQQQTLQAEYNYSLLEK